MTIYEITPIYDQTVWGNNKLASRRGIKGDRYGTSWEISFHEYGSNQILNTENTLIDLLDKNSHSLLGGKHDNSLLRLAYLDTKSELSIQVHPTTDYAKKFLEDEGKYEAWYIIEAEENATLVAGCKTDDIDEVVKAIKNNSLEELLIYHPVKAGDYIYIPAGGIHALGGGILAIELSTNSNTTYRVYDYGRKDDKGLTRELHLKEALENIDLSIRPTVNHLNFVDDNKTIVKEFINNEYFVWKCIDLFDDFIIKNNKEALYITILDDNITLQSDEKNITPKKYDHIFVSADTSEIRFSGVGRILIGYTG